MEQFAGKVAVVTGAASGMGLAFATRFCREGMKVVLADVEAERLGHVVAELTHAEHDVLGVLTDVSSAEGVEALARQALAAYGKVHVLCNNAGVVSDSELRDPEKPARYLWEHSLNDWTWTYGVNLWGVVHGIRTFLPIMLGQGEEGHIVNTSSITGLTSGTGLPIYASTKHAVVRISEGLYSQLTEIEAPIGVSVLCPGGVDTRISLASRNRPESLRDEGTATEEERAERELRRRQRGPTPSQLQPETVAGLVFDAISERRFYILPHDDWDDGIRERADEILARRNPAIRAL